MAVHAFVKQAAFSGLCWLARLRSMVSPRKVVLFCIEPTMSRKLHAIAGLLRKHGIPATVRSSLERSSRVQLKSSRDLFIGNWNSVEPDQMPRHYIFWNAEPISIEGWSEDRDWGPPSEFHLRWHYSHARRKQWLAMMANAKAVWDYSLTNQPLVSKTGLPFTHVPFGYAQAYEEEFSLSNSGKHVEQDIDVLFFGWVSQRRQEILEELVRRGMKVHVASFKNPAWDVTLNDLLARSKIVLGIHCYTEPSAHLPDFARFDYLISNRLFAIHEQVSPAGLGTGLEENLTTAPYEALVDTCAHFLGHPEERAQLAENAYHWFKSAYALEDYLPFDQVRSLLASRRN